MSDETKVNVVDDEAALDAELAADIENIKAGNKLEEKPQEKTEASGPTGPTGQPSPEGDVKPTGEAGSKVEAPGDPQATEVDGEEEYRIPNKGKFESDEAYEKRIELFDLVKRRKNATTPEAKEALSVDIKKAKGELKTLGAADRFIQQKPEGAKTDSPVKPGESAEVDPDLAADRERLKQLGGATREDIEEAIRQTTHEAAVRSDIQRFVEKHPELKDEDVREVFFDFVDNNYVWQGKSGKELVTTLEMARENMFRPSESVQERVLKGAGVQEKVNAMQFPGGTGAKTTYSPEIQKSIDELKATGMSEDKAIELLSE